MRPGTLMIFVLGALILPAGAMVAGSAHASAQINIVNLDGAGEGFNDPTPWTPAGGNPAVTVGAARLIAFRYAASLWTCRLASSVEIRVDARFDPLTCSPTQAVLGSASTTTLHRDWVTGTPPAHASTWYPQALANSLAGADLDPASDIVATFNSDLDNAVCLGGISWYYGLDGNPPAGDIDLVTVVLHELGHGLGFQTFANLATGVLPGGFNDTYGRNMERHSASPSAWSAMSNGQRVAAATADPSLHWIGAGVLARAPSVLSSGIVNGHVQLYAPATLEPGSSVAHFSTSLVPNEGMEPAYAGPNHDLGLGLDLLVDIGWQLAPPGSASLIAHYRFDTVSNRGLDASVNGHTGILGAATIVQGVSSLASVIFGDALGFDPDNGVEEFSVPHHQDFDILGEMTGTAWIRPRGNHTIDNNPNDCIEGTIFSKGGNYWFQIGQTNADVVLQNEGSGTDVVRVAVSGGINLNSWTHVAFVRSVDGHFIQVYVNGTLRGAGYLANSPVSTVSPVTVGNYGFGGPGGCEFNGDIDELKIFDGCLNEAEILTEYRRVANATGIATIPALDPRGLSLLSVAMCALVVRAFRRRTGRGSVAPGPGPLER